MSHRVLVVEDDIEVATSLRLLLEREGYEVEVAMSIAQARSLLSRKMDIMLLDWRLPDGEGIELLKELRKTSDLPVLMVTARVEVIDRVLGLEIGADDYITKPVEPRELLARVKARLRPRNRENAAPVVRVFEHAGVRVNMTTRDVTYHGSSISMTRMELNLLAVLIEYPGRVFSREELLNLVWGYERTPTTRTVDTHIVQLRTKLCAEFIESVRGIGYRFVRNLTESEP